MNHPRPSRRSIRLKDYDYSQPGGYFLTLVTFQRAHLFGEIANGVMELNEAGNIVRQVWEKLPGRYPNVVLDEMVIMPNHFHGIVIFADDPPAVVVAAVHRPVAAVHHPVAAVHEPPLLHRRRMLLPKLVGYFKMNSAKAINLRLNSSGVPVWQRNYYEHVIRSQNELDRIRNYVSCNPLQWEQDDENC